MATGRAETVPGAAKPEGIISALRQEAHKNAAMLEEVANDLRRSIDQLLGGQPMPGEGAGSTANAPIPPFAHDMSEQLTRVRRATAEISAQITRLNDAQ